MWWRHFGADKALWVLIARDAHGAVAGIAPLMRVNRGWGLLRVRCVQFIGTGVVLPAHLNWLLRKDCAEEASAALTGYLLAQRSEWDLLELDGVDEAATLPGQLRRAGGFLRERPRKATTSPYIELPATWEAYKRDYLSRNMRHNLRHFANRMQKDTEGCVEFKRLDFPADVDAALDALTALHHQRWHEQGKRTTFDDPAFVQFHKDFARTALERGWLRYFQLFNGSELWAVIYCFRYGDVFSAYQIGFSAAAERYSPGQLIYGHAIETAIGEKTRLFDLLQGAHEYKQVWTKTARIDRTWLYAPGARGRIWMLMTGLLDRGALIVKRWLPESLQARIKRLVCHLYG